ncbi:MAG: hypothetical protein JST20_05890 [Bacteroidetes bacterium]|nr:hypothetical protein [Bacteroidota bacterium]
MAIRQDDSITITLKNLEQFNNKTDIREFLLKQWISESPQKKYRYFVEVLNSGKHIYLERPGRLNKGCDFVIYVENIYQWKNGNDRPPNHDFVLNDLKLKKNIFSQQQWDKLLLCVNEIFNSKPYRNTIQFTNELPIIGHDYELLLKLIKWLFIEQDITYWSGEGRELFYRKINEL